MGRTGGGRGIRLVAVDLDGTLIDSSKSICPEIKTLVDRLHLMGVRFTIATGRFHESAVKYAHELGLNTPIITSSGACIAAASGHVQCDLRIPFQVAKDIVRESEKTAGVLYAFSGNKVFVNKPSTFSPRYSKSLAVPIHLKRDLLAHMNQDPTMLVLRFPEPCHAKAVREKMRDLVGNKVRVISSMPYFVDFLHPGASKANALKALCASLGIDPEEVLAIGDGENDLEMLQWAGTGALVSNAPESIKDKADYVSQGESTEGVMEIVRRFVFERPDNGRISQENVEEAQ